MTEQLNLILKDGIAEISAAANNAELVSVRVKYLGKKGLLTAILRSMGTLSSDERRDIGVVANNVRESLENEIETKNRMLSRLEMDKRLDAEKIDITLPSKKRKIGSLHPIHKTEIELRSIFISMGFDVVEGPEIETVINNFDKLNAPEDHPSRDYQDTFYFSDSILLRTQTSPVQIRAMSGKTPPIKIISPGRVFRSEDIDATHAPMFHQLEGLVIDRGITIGDLKGTLDLFAKKFFGEQTKTRFRPHNFPFTEPSAEVDISCFACGGKGCRICKNEGWIELLGSGMVHPNVLTACGIDPDIYSGFAFGIGIDRASMMKYNINDLRLMFENDVRFLRQF